MVADWMDLGHGLASEEVVGWMVGQCMGRLGLHPCRLFTRSAQYRLRMGVDRCSRRCFATYWYCMWQGRKRITKAMMMMMMIPRPRDDIKMCLFCGSGDALCIPCEHSATTEPGGIIVGWGIVRILGTMGGYVVH